MNAVDAAREPRVRRKAPAAGVLYDAPGPRARRRNLLYTVLSGLALAGLLAWIGLRLNQAGQFDAGLWTPFLHGDVWTSLMLPGLVGTLKATAIAGVLALAFGLVFGLGRLSDHRWVRVPSALIVEFFRAIPLLILIFFIAFGPATVGTALNLQTPEITPLMAVVGGLTLYNGAVLAEVFRAGVLAVPTGQREAAYAIGLRKGQALRLVLVPQAVTAMMPAIVSQLVVLLKDSALGWLISYEDLLNAGFRFVPANYHNLIPAAFVTAVIYIAINLTLSRTAIGLEARARRSVRTAAAPLPARPADGQATDSYL